MKRTDCSELENDARLAAPQRQDADTSSESEILTLLARIENKLDAISQEKRVQDYYSVAEFAERVERSEFTTREWCRLGRIKAVKRSCGRGRALEWMIPHEEWLRFMSHGLRPDPRRQPPPK